MDLTLSYEQLGIKHLNEVNSLNLMESLGGKVPMGINE